MVRGVNWDGQIFSWCDYDAALRVAGFRGLLSVGAAQQTPRPAPHIKISGGIDTKKPPRAELVAA